ncbi:MAG: trigger factor [Gammaproteobacteria bacterium RIFCSPHIGHO2_02_FULL_42_13]|nr:MAG: trigger factor [Gammaproteobacteria bacterium RIFCSPHIGHO2_02_FULL_42_13]OGT67734.1 MAG: trigger factor [Gammaproteobacteria bacterium RIFCSPLOWO2_02_FULL_42_9]
MQVSVKNNGKLERCLTISVPPERFQEGFQKQLKKIAQTAKLHGFRPGKVPLKVVEWQYGKSIRQEVLNDLLQATLTEAIQQENLKLAGYPKFEIKKFKDKEPLEYDAIFEVYPEIKLVNFAKTKFEKTSSDVSDSDLDKMIENLRKQRMEWELVNRAAKNGDRMVVDFEGFLDGQPFLGGKVEKFSVVLGSKSMIAGFEEGLVGVKAGDEKEISVTFPKEHQQKDLAGKNTTFKIKVNEVFEPKLPELNDEFFKLFNIQEGGLDRFKLELRATMEKELKNALHNINKKVVIEQLCKLHKFDIPKALIESEIDAMVWHTQDQAKRGGAKEVPEIDREKFRESAIRHVSSVLIIQEYVVRLNLKSDPARVRETIETWARHQDHPDEVVRAFYGTPERLAQVELFVLEDQAVDMLLESAKVKEKHLSYEDVMRMQYASQSGN